MMPSAEIQRPFFSDLLGARPGASARPGLEKRELRVARAQRTHGLGARAAQAAWSQRSGGRQRLEALPSHLSQRLLCTCQLPDGRLLATRGDRPGRSAAQQHDWAQGGEFRQLRGRGPAGGLFERRLARG